MRGDQEANEATRKEARKERLQAVLPCGKYSGKAYHIAATEPAV